MKKDKWSAVKEILFTYLAINKIMYWYNTIMTMNQSDLNLGEVGQAILFRLLGNDLLLIAGVAMFFFMDRRISQKKSNNSGILDAVKFYVIGYVALFGLTAAYIWIMSWFVPVQLDSLRTDILNGTLGYLVVVVVLNLKYYFKSKEKSIYAGSATSTEDKLSMLQVLLDDGILSQEEFDQKKLLCK